MEFWGVEVKPGETVKCEPGDDQYLHLSQASVGVAQKDKGNENIVITVAFNGQKLVIGTLSSDKCPQIAYDLIFEKKFELSHTWKNGSVFFVGYKAFTGDKGPDVMDDGDSEDVEEDAPTKEVQGKDIAKSNLSKPNIGAQKPPVVVDQPSVKVDPKGAGVGNNEDDSDDNEDDSEEDESDDEGMGDSEDDSDDEVEDESSPEEDEQTPRKAGDRKRAAAPASKTPVPAKRAKLVTPVGNKKAGGGVDGKKSGHTGTPHPAKLAQKTTSVSDKSKQQSAKSAGSVPCKSCNRTFKDESALRAHTLAKHATAK